MQSIYTQIIFWFLITLAAFFIGLFLKKVILPRVRKVTRETHVIMDDALVKGMQKITLPIFTLFGFWIGFKLTNVFPDKHHEIQEGITVVFIALMTWCIIVIVDEIAHWQMNKIGKIIPRSSILLNLINVSLGLIGLLFILQYLGISILPALTALGVGGLAVALALQDTLSNLFAGLQLIASQKIKVGDYLVISASEEGILEDVSWRNSTIRTLSNHLIIIPNSTLASSIVKNFELPDIDNSILVPVGVSYGSDLKHVERVTIEVATEIQQTVDGAVRDHQPFTRYNEFADSSINFNVILRGSGFTSQFLIKHEFIKALHERYNKEGIEIPFPIRTVHLKNEEQPNVGDKS